MATSLIRLSIMMNLVVLYFSTNWLPTVLIGSGLHTGDAVRTTAYFQVGGTIGALVVGYLADRIMPTLVPGVAFACAALFIRIVGSVGANLGPVLPAVLCAGFRIADGQAGANAFVGGFYPTRVRATGVGWALSIGRMGSVVGPVVADWFLARGWKSASILYCAVVPAALAGLAMVAIGRSGQRRPDSTRITMKKR